MMKGPTATPLSSFLGLQAISLGVQKKNQHMSPLLVGLLPSYLILV